jgi:hypothetical protein
MKFPFVVGCAILLSTVSAFATTFLSKHGEFCLLAATSACYQISSLCFNSNIRKNESIFDTYSFGKQQLTNNRSVTRYNVVLQEGLRSGGQTLNDNVPRLKPIGNNYNLILSRTSIRQILQFTALFFSAYLYITSFMKTKNLVFDSRIIQQMIPPYMMISLSFGTKLLLPLLASSCCMIQLLMNIIAGGCAGFNTSLGPYRPFSLSLLIFLTIIRFPYVPIWIHAIRWFVSLMPEMVHFYNYSKQSKYMSNAISSLVSTAVKDGDYQLYNKNSRTYSPNDVSSSDNNNHHIVTTKFKIPSMGCVACINKLIQ